MTSTVIAPGTAMAAEPRPTHDRRIEEAAIRMLQPKLGEIRGSLDLTERNHLFPPLRQRLVDSGKAAWPMFDGAEQTSRSIIRY
ncbi:hypothetical protein [Hoeflea sp.]|uniref:hypothetical protein n=1 Tax=Hoeflea sp. TaxID=1940281 RepID=UPI003748DA67